MCILVVVKWNKIWPDYDNESCQYIPSLFVALLMVQLAL